MAEWSLLINQIVVNCCASETPHVKFMKVNFGLLDQDSLWLDKMFDRWLSDTLIHYKSCWEMKVVLTCLKANLYRNKNFYVQTSVQIDSHIFAMGNKYTDQIELYMYTLHLLHAPLAIVRSCIYLLLKAVVAPKSRMCKCVSNERKSHLKVFPAEFLWFLCMAYLSLKIW